MTFSKICPACGGREFTHNDVLWSELISEWELVSHEIDYINRQQGFSCTSCGNNLRSMALADAILKKYKFIGTLSDFVKSELAHSLNVLEINEAGGLTSTLSQMPHHLIVKYPDYDMTNLSLDKELFDLVIHSDTLEHVPDPGLGLSECYRILNKNGKCIFTVPIIVDRVSRSRSNLVPSYHGRSEVQENDHLVYTEFGMDIWDIVLKAGFRSCEIYSFEYPAALVLIAKKGSD